MRNIIKSASVAIACGAGLAGAANAQQIELITGDISTSTTWTSDKIYRLEDQVYVEPGATLTIEAGTLIASTTGVGGSLAVARGAQINVLGNRRNPVIMTSTSDVETWPVGPNDNGVANRRSGTWRAASNEWGNLTIMGGAYISEDATVGNTAGFSASNVATMEGLQRGGAIDEYGGGDDNYDAGTIRFLSLRYGGKVIGLGNELNALSLGGVGRDTDIHHIDIMNNVDDGIEIWGGTVNLKYCNIWYIGDDSFDVDQGWRGQAQFVQIVQGYSTDASQGSGIGDNCFEVDGAENSWYQPRTRAQIFNATVIGQPNDGDGGTAWRDNAGVQYRNCIFMDLGERLVRFDDQDGDGGAGYGVMGTLSWADHWTTSASVFPAGGVVPPNPATFYNSQDASGMICEIIDSVFFRNFNGSAYTEATARGVLPGNSTNNNVLIPGFDPADAPIREIVRAAPVPLQGGSFLQFPIERLDPRPANEAVASVAAAPANGFYTSASYRGAFAPDTRPWVCGWTAADQFGFIAPCKVTVANGPKGPVTR